MDDQHDPGSPVSAPTAEPVGSADPAPPGERPEGGGARRPGRHASGSHRRDPAQKNASAGRKRKHFWRELLIVVLAAAVITLLVKAFIVQVYKIPTGSMENTLQVNDRVLVNKLVYDFRGIARGDIVVFSGQDSWGPDAPPPSSDPVVRLWDDVLSDIGLSSSQTYYIKRVIGLPGDRVACCTDGKVTVNGVPLTESSYLYPGDAPSSFKFSVTVPPGHIWVMGDHRGDSDDSRYHTSDPGDGSVPENEVVGRAFLIIWPPSQIRDLPIPSTFDQAALHAGAAGAAVLQVGGTAVAAGGTLLGAVATAPVAGTAGAAGVIGAPLLLLRRRLRRRSDGKRSRPSP
jgi:signal peptidase I